MFSFCINIDVIVSVKYDSFYVWVFKVLFLVIFFKLYCDYIGIYRGIGL